MDSFPPEQDATAEAKKSYRIRRHCVGSDAEVCSNRAVAKRKAGSNNDQGKPFAGPDCRCQMDQKRATGRVGEKWPYRQLQESKNT